ncbi:hypothetical protein [Azospirillum melinis]
MVAAKLESVAILIKSESSVGIAVVAMSFRNSRTSNPHCQRHSRVAPSKWQFCNRATIFETCTPKLLLSRDAYKTVWNVANNISYLAMHAWREKRS